MLALIADYRDFGSLFKSIMEGKDRTHVKNLNLINVYA